MAGRDTKTRYQSVYARHSIGCPKTANRNLRCRCDPSYFGVVFDPTKGAKGGTRKTPHLKTAKAANDAKGDLAKLVAAGKTGGAGVLTLQEVADRFMLDAKEGVALSKRGRPYRPSAAASLKWDLDRLPEKLRSRRFDRVNSADLQHVVDDLVREGLSGSRIQSVINSTRSMYWWAKKRGYASANVATDVQLPALNSKKRDRVASPPEMVALISALDLADRAPLALASFGGIRSDEIRQLDWPHIDFKADVILVVDGKTDAANRVVPISRYLKAYMRAEWMRQGRPKTGPVCPARRASKSNRLGMGQLLKRIYKVWDTEELTRINLHECRHTCLTWLDAAGVRPKVVSEWAGHSTPERQRGAAPITQNTYTHLLDGDLEEACRQLDNWLDAKLADGTKEMALK